MENNLNLNTYLKAAVRHRLYSNERNLKNHLKYIFSSINLEGSSVLDIGGGAGLLSLYVTSQGGRATCLEPDSDGSTHGNKQRFLALQADLPSWAKNGTFISSTFQEFDKDLRFDLIVIANAINHLDESACQTLLESKDSKTIYLSIFSKLRESLRPNGLLIATDCGRSNLFNSLGLTNPLMPTIEWAKHQNPSTWRKLLAQCGFTHFEVTYSPFNSLGSIGPILQNNLFVNYFTTSHFRLSCRSQD
jgi:2-polyprenyl-3-methyl-5-hydroxy-6-metoxy-1,4-benzoquinol methylase